MEVIGDEQMWAFQQDKKRRIAAGEDVAQPFINTGLFRYSRHPSHLSEMVMWFAFYLFAVSASGTWLHWTGLGFILLIAQFLGAIPLTESISASKYPAYAGVPGEDADAGAAAGASPLAARGNTPPQSTRIRTFRNLTTPAPYCSAIAPEA